MTDGDANPFTPPQATSEGTGFASGHVTAPLAGRAARFWAATLDGLCFVAIGYAWSWLVPIDAQDSRWWTGELVGDLLCEIAFLIPNLYLLASRGQTIGKALLGIRIVGLTGDRVGVGRIVMRRMLPVSLASYLPYYLLQPDYSARSMALAILILPVIDALFILRRDQRCLHDLIAGTRVVKVIVQSPV